jgi:Uncharacterized protein conserved in bacteria (DUF2252)
MDMDIHSATRSYEAWLARCTPGLVASQLRDKHEMMRADPFVFLRGTYYRWVQLWGAASGDLARAPRLLGVGDLHIDSYGTWRDVEGRLCWGIDDFDDACPLPYTNDLVRWATSLKISIDAGTSTIPLRDGCDAFVERYAATLRRGGDPFVLAEGEAQMDKLGISELKPPDDFWRKLNSLPVMRRPVPAAVARAFRDTLPGRRLDYRVVRREAGTGSMGQVRYVAIAEWDGGCVAREAKALVPPASSWAAGVRGRGQPYYARALDAAVRAPDPFHCVVGPWLIRRLSPDSNPILVADLPKRRDESVLLGAMGAEVANVHLGSLRQPRQRGRILTDLRRRPPNWLRRSAKMMAKIVEREWQEYRDS